MPQCFLSGVVFTVRKLTQLFLVVAALVATPAFAEMKIAVMNYQMALLESDAAKRYAVDAEKKFFCNGEYLVRAKDFSLKGEPLQHFTFNGPVPKGFMFVMGQHKDSFDSRYFGFVEKSRILAKAYPIF